MAPSRADLNSKAMYKARHQVVFTKRGSNVAFGSNGDIKCWFLHPSTTGAILRGVCRRRDNTPT